MYSFQSHNRSHDVQLPSKKVVSFSDYTYSTNDTSVGDELTLLCGKNFWRIDNLKVELDKTEPMGEETPPAVEIPKRRGRPPRVVQGMRMVDTGEKGEEQ
jgi:hypothetical protein